MESTWNQRNSRDPLLPLITLSQHLRFSLQVCPTLPSLLTGCFGWSIVSDFIRVQIRLAGDSVHYHKGTQADRDSSCVCFFNHCARGKETWRTVQGHLKHLPRSAARSIIDAHISHFMATTSSKVGQEEQPYQYPGRELKYLWAVLMFPHQCVVCSLKFLINED